MAKGRRRKSTTETESSQNSGAADFRTELWGMADALRGSMDAAEYKHVVLGLIFLKYISDAFEEAHAKLVDEVAEGADPEDPDEYRAKSIFWVPPEARWPKLQSQAHQPTIGRTVDDAMTAIERDNPALKDVLPKDYARPALDKTRLGQVVDMVSNIKVGGAEARATDVLGSIYEYFLGQFALAEGRKGGEFYTPRSIVRLLVEMLKPYEGRVYDPCCGSSGMFVQSMEFIDAHTSGIPSPGAFAPGEGQAGGGSAREKISIYGQESNYTTWRMAQMNLAIRGIEGQIAHGDSFHNDRHPDLKADYILANPPFNVSDWGGERLRDDKRWEFGVPPVGNANFAWVQHFVHHLAPRGTAGFVLANGSMSSNQSNEGEIRKNIIEANLVDCIVALPGQLFRSTQIPACLWFISRDRGMKPSPGASRHPLPQGEGRCAAEGTGSGSHQTPSRHPLPGGEGRCAAEGTGSGTHQTPSRHPLPQGEGRCAAEGIGSGTHQQPSRHPLPQGEGHYRGGLEFSGLLERAREMREKATPAEAFAWELFRDRQFLGLKFRRQHQIGNYIVDFYCDEKRLVVELDGSVHDSDERRTMDRNRDAYLESLGMTVVRIKNQHLLQHTQEALNEIADALNPSPAGRGEGVRIRDQAGEVLFIDARKLGHMIDRTRRDLSPEDIARVADTYHAWRGRSVDSPLPLGEGQGEGVAVYRDIPGFCKSASLEEIRKHGHVLTPGRYVGAEPQEDDGEPFEEKMARLTAQWREQQAEARRLDSEIEENLARLGFG